MNWRTKRRNNADRRRNWNSIFLKGNRKDQKRGTTQRKRGGKALPCEVEMDLSGNPKENMMKSSLGNTKELHRAVLEHSEHQEDVKLYGRLPDYDDSQCYDLGREDILRQIGMGIYVNIHRPSWKTLKHHLFTIKPPNDI